MGVKLNILNAMLASIGSSSIVTDTGNNPSLQRALPVLERKNLTVQAQGHWFNTEWGLELSPNGDGEYIVPQTTLKAEPTDEREPYVRRGTRMYDPTEHTYVINGGGKLKLDIVINLGYDDLPQTAADLIEAAAILEFVTNFDADQLTIAARSEAYKRALEAFNIDRRSQRNVSLRDNPTYARIMHGAQYAGRHPNPNIIGG